jgi:hypothetical protein
LLRFAPSTTATAHPHAVTVVRTEAQPGAYVSPEAFHYYHAKDGDEILIRPDGYLA